jgi:hypothetical protein
MMTRNKSRVEGGVVYIFRCGKLHKIGATVNFARRAKEYATHSTGDFVLIKKTKDPFGVERLLHELYAKKRVRNDFFKLGFFTRWYLKFSFGFKKPKESDFL